MHKYISTSNNPAINLATEEYLLKNRNEDILMLYVDAPSIICGKHQNALAEVNFGELQKLNLELYRRLSGGGTVYHDEGNLNFCFITNGENHNLINFKGFTNHIIESLKMLNVNAEFGGRNDLLINNKKISGNACHVYKKRVMHHGTLLYSSNLKNLGELLKTDPTKYTDRAVKSVRSLVTNINEHLDTKLDFKDFVSHIFNNTFPQAKPLEITKNELDTIKDLANSKYKSWEWNFGYSPEYKSKRILEIDQTKLLIEITVLKGLIEKIEVQSNKPSHLTSILKELEGKKHEYNTLRTFLKEKTKIDSEEKLDHTTLLLM